MPKRTNCGGFDLNLLAISCMNRCGCGAFKIAKRLSCSGIFELSATQSLLPIMTYNVSFCITEARNQATNIRAQRI